MGWEWEVEAWLPVQYPRTLGPSYLWVPVYQGDSSEDADHARLKAAGEGAGAVRTTWRPS